MILAQLNGCRVCVDLEVATPQIQKIAALLAAKALKELANAIHRECVALGRTGCPTEWAATS